MTLVSIAIYVVLALIGLGLLAMVIFGLRSMTYGKVKPFNVAVVLIPVVLLIVLGFVIGNWSLAAIYTVFTMFGLAILALLVTGAKGIFN